MSVLQLVINLFTPDDGINSSLAHSGTINIESGMAEIKSHHFALCEHCKFDTSLIRECRHCGRTKGNNVRFLAGLGDGVYSGFTLSNNLEVLACLYVFDEDNKLAQAISQGLNGDTLYGNNFQDDLMASLKDFADCEAYKLGTVQAKFAETQDVGFITSDAAAYLGSSYSEVDQPFARGNFHVYLFMEPILNSSTVQFALERGADPEGYNRGHQDALRPRVALIVKDAVESKVLRKINSGKVDWNEQATVWADTIVTANTFENSGQANLMNGLMWAAAANDQTEIFDENPANKDILYLYSTRAFGYLLQSALCGSEMGLQLASEQVAALSDESSLINDSFLKDCLLPRGVVATDEVIKLLGVESSAKTTKVLCGNCGNKYAEQSEFCQNCGTKL